MSSLSCKPFCALSDYPSSGLRLSAGPRRAGQGVPPASPMTPELQGADSCLAPTKPASCTFNLPGPRALPFPGNEPALVCLQGGPISRQPSQVGLPPQAPGNCSQALGRRGAVPGRCVQLLQVSACASASAARRVPA